MILPGLVEHIRKACKVELHLHLEGSVMPGLLSDLSRRHGTHLAALSAEEIEAEIYRFGNFYEFLDRFGLICRHLRDPEDYCAALADLEVYLIEENIRYAEVIYSPSIPWKFGRDGREILAALAERAGAFERRSGIPVRWILDCVRQFGRDLAERTAELAAEFSENGVVGLGLGGDEKAVGAAEYEEIFSWARAHGLFVHVHAGEIGGPEEIWEAVERLGANRIGHGIHAARDAKLMDYLKEHAVGLDVCLTSNLKTRAWPLLGDHPFPLLLRRGVPVSLSTDDPGLFGIRLGGELCKAAEAYGLTVDEVNRIILHGVHTSFLPSEPKKAMMQKFTDQLSRSN